MGGTSGIIKNDKYLTNLALAYPVGNLVGEIVAPVKPTSLASDKVFVDSDDAINKVNDYAEGTEANEVDDSVGTPYNFNSTRKALSGVVLDKQAANAEAIVRLEQRRTFKLTNMLRLRHELRVASILTNTSKVTQYKNVDSSAGARWDEASPDLETDIVLALKAIKANTGVIANTIVIPFEAAIYAAKMAFIKNTLQYQYGMEYVQASFQNQVMAAVGLPPYIKGLKVVISGGRVNTSVKGQAKSVSNPWGKDCLIGYVPPQGFVEDQFGILTMQYSPLAVFRERLINPSGTRIIVDWDYDILEADLKNWYLLQNVIA